ncbi:MAG: ABC transporter permease [Legionellales bacterium RIFCSPHIGHO2_12_FULL_37_14]|nr:MAG: ABC transporter permease [Legionellales bacterium RIFCSPHIGHO2_12_FULL_37_14]
MSVEVFLTSILQGLILAFVAYGVMIPFRILDFPDLTAEGAYPLGGAVCASYLLIGGSPIVATLLGALAAGIMATGTAFAHLRLKVNTLLAGIILSTMVYSVNLRLMGKPNLALFNHTTLYGENWQHNVLLLLGFLLLTILPLFLFLKTEAGLRLRAVGFNPLFMQRQNISVARYTYLGLFIAGCFSGISGSLMVQYQSYMDIGMGVGIVIHALAALMIGEALLGTKKLTHQLAAPLVGALVYQQIQGFALSLGLAPTDLKFFTGALVLIVIGLRRAVEARSA